MLNRIGKWRRLELMIVNHRMLKNMCERIFYKPCVKKLYDGKTSCFIKCKEINKYVIPQVVYNMMASVFQSKT